MKLVVVISYIHLAVVLAQGHIECSIPTAEPGKDTDLICHFPEDLNVTKKDFSIYHYPADGKADAVIDCWWRSDILNCFVNSGYKYNRTVNTQLAVTISHVASVNAGTYSCQITGYRPNSFGTCHLNIGQRNIDGRIACFIPPVQPDEDAALMCIFPEDLNVTKKDFSVYYYTKDINPEAVLDCWWMAGTLKCFVNPGYTYNMNVNTQLTLNISHVTSLNTGTYACQIAGYRPSSFGTCQFETEQINREKKIMCFMPPVQLGKEASFSCHFPEDLSVTKKDFSVYHYTKNGDAVVDCWWINGKLKCLANPGYKYKKTDDTTLTVTISHVTESHAGAYVCQIAGYRPSSFGICTVEIRQDAIEDHGNPVVIVVSTVLVVAVLLAIVIIVVMMKYRRWFRCKRNDGTQSGEDQPMIVIHDKRVTEEFQELLLKNVREMFPSMLNDWYFVPPIVFNKTRYKIDTIAGQVVHIPDPPDPSDVQYNQAMQSVLSCLMCIAITKQEQMFVLTHFNYDDYLKNPKQNFVKHGLPVPAGQNIRKRDNQIGCFDFLIIHRQYGVLVGVVKTVSDKDDGSQATKKKIDDLVVKEMSEAITQLTKAVRMIKHLMSDQNQPLKVRQTFILPNAANSTLNRVLHNHTDLAQKLRKCFQTEDVPIQLCLCADQLIDRHLTTWWDSLMNMSADDYIMKDDLFECLIARFCGPATVSTLDIPRTPDSLPLPKTFDQAVSFTGDLFDRFTLYPGMTDLIQEPRVFLSGPPGTGKTRLLGLVGRKWLSEGHVVQIVNTSTELTSATIQLIKILQEAQSSGISPNGMVVSLNCNTKRRQDIRDVIFKLEANAGEKPVFVLADDLEINAEKSQQIHKFFKCLLYRFPDIYCWASSCSTENAPVGWRSEILTVPISCPPSVLREAMKEERIPGVAPYSQSKFTPPTEGLPVMRIPHYYCSSNTDIDYKKCGNEILRFLSQALCMSGIGANPGTMDVLSSEHQSQYRQPTGLQYKDILLLFEDDVTQFMPVVTAFKESGVPVEIIDYKNQQDVLNSNAVIAANAGFLCGIKRKVVIYVEGNKELSDLTATWNKLRSITSCTSQLVLVSSPFKHIMNAVLKATDRMFTNLFGPI